MAEPTTLTAATVATSMLVTATVAAVAPELQFGGVQLGQFLAHRGFPADEHVAAGVEAKGVYHKLLAVDQAQVGRLAHALAQARPEVTPVDHRV